MKRKLFLFVLMLSTFMFTIFNQNSYAESKEYTYRVIVTSINHNTDWWYSSSQASGQGRTADGTVIKANKVVDNTKGKSGNWGQAFFKNEQCYYDLTFDQPITEVEITWSGWNYNWATGIKVVANGESVNTSIDKAGWAKVPIIDTIESVLDIEPAKEKINIAEEVYADLTINNIREIAAEDIRIKYDNEKLQFIGFEEVEGIKLVKSIEDTGNGELRVILASKGETNIINDKKSLLRLKFKGVKAGEAKVDIVRGRVSDGIEMEKDLTDEQCGEGIIIIEGVRDVNNSGEFTLLDLAIDARHLGKDPESLPQYNTDIVVNGAIDGDDLLEIARLMLENPNYTPNNK